MRIPKPKKTVEVISGLHQCPGCLLWYPASAMKDVVWRRDKIGPYTETVEFCSNCESKRHEGETGERLMYRMRELRLAVEITIVSTRRRNFFIIARVLLLYALKQPSPLQLSQIYQHYQILPALRLWLP